MVLFFFLDEEIRQMSIPFFFLFMPHHTNKGPDQPVYSQSDQGLHNQGISTL